MEQLADEIGTTKTTISRLERGVSRYTQDHLDAIAHALRTTPEDLIARAPNDTEIPWRIWSNLSAEQRRQVIDIMKTFAPESAEEQVA